MATDLRDIVDLETFDPNKTYLITHHPEHGLHYAFNLRHLEAPKTHTDYLALAKLLLPLEKRFGEVIRIDRAESFVKISDTHAVLGRTYVRIPPHKEIPHAKR